MDENERIASLVANSLLMKLTPAEDKELQHWINETPRHRILFEDWTKEENVLNNLADYIRAERDAKAMWPVIKARMEKQIVLEKKKS